MADDQTGTTGRGDAYNEPIPAQGAAPLLKSELPPQNETKQPVTHGAIQVVSLDDLLAPNTSELPAPKVIPPLSVMPHPSVPSIPTPTQAAPPVTPATASTPVAPKPIDSVPARTTPTAPVSTIALESRPAPKEIEPFIRRTTQPVSPSVSHEVTTAIATSAPKMNPPISERITPVPPVPQMPPTPTIAIPESVILSETVRPPEKSAAPAPIASIENQVSPSESAASKSISPAEPAVSVRPSWGPFRDNISSILNAIKLPERFDAKTSGDIKNRPRQEASEPMIISETVTPASKQPAAIQHDGPAPLHFANETISVAPVTPTPKVMPSPPVASKPASTPQPITIAPALDTTPDVGLPTHAAPTFPPIPKIHPPATYPPAPTPAPAPIVSPPVSIPEEHPEQTPEDHSIVTPMRTFKEDLMHVVHDRKISLISAVALEEDKKRETRQPSPAEIAITRQRRRRTFAIFYTIVILFGLSIAALYGVYTVQNQHATPAPNPNSSSIIFAEQTFSFPLQDLSASDIKRALSQSQGASSASLGSITRIIPTVKNPDGTARAATTAEFFKALDLHVSDDLVRALDSDFFFGIHTIDKNSAVLIIPVNSYERAFAGMLAWEPAMNTDLAPAFTPVSEFTTDANGLPQRRLFEDVVMRNYDTRALKDDSGTIQMYYSFPTPNILIISENPFSFTEILSRLQVQRRL